MRSTHQKLSKCLLLTAMGLALSYATACNSSSAAQSSAPDSLPQFDEFNNPILRLLGPPSGNKLFKKCYFESSDNIVSYSCPDNLIITITNDTDPDAVAMMSLETPRDKRYSIELGGTLHYATFKWDTHTTDHELASYRLFMQDEKKPRVIECSFRDASESPDLQPCLDHIASIHKAWLWTLPAPHARD